MADDKKLTTRAENFSDWYNELVLKAELADYSPVKGVRHFHWHQIRGDRLRSCLGP